MKFEEMINTVQLGDCYELIKNIPDKSIDLIVIDPPYSFCTGGKHTGLFKSRDTRYHDQIEEHNLDKNIDLSILNELDRIMKKTNIYILLQTVGRKTLDIYMIHYFLLSYIPLIGNFITNSNNVVLELSIVTFLSIIVIICSLLISDILRMSKNLSALLFGVKNPAQHE